MRFIAPMQSLWSIVKRVTARCMYPVSQGWLCGEERQKPLYSKYRIMVQVDAIVEGTSSLQLWVE